MVKSGKLMLMKVNESKVNKSVQLCFKNLL